MQKDFSKQEDFDRREKAIQETARANLKRIRKENGLTQSQVRELCLMGENEKDDNSKISSLETGKINVTFKWLARYSVLFGVSPAEMLDEGGIRPQKDARALTMADAIEGLEALDAAAGVTLSEDEDGNTIIKLEKRNLKNALRQWNRARKNKVESIQDGNGDYAEEDWQAWHGPFMERLRRQPLSLYGAAAIDVGREKAALIAVQYFMGSHDFKGVGDDDIDRAEAYLDEIQRQGDKAIEEFNASVDFALPGVAKTKRNMYKGAARITGAPIATFYNLARYGIEYSRTPREDRHETKYQIWNEINSYEEETPAADPDEIE